MTTGFDRTAIPQKWKNGSALSRTIKAVAIEVLPLLFVFFIARLLGWRQP